MEAAASTTTPQAPAPDLKLKIDKFSDGAIVCLKFNGTIDEDFDGKKLAATVKAGTLVLDLAEVKKISSFGIREWVDFMNLVAKQAASVVLLECAPKVVDQLNMVANFAGSGQVFSFYAPYRCDYCDSESRLLMQVDKDFEVIKSMKPPERPCAQCGEPEYFDEDPTTYFSYIITQDRFELETDVAAFLSSKLNYTVSDSARKLRIDKIIEGRSTYLKMAGDLDGSFPREKLAEGLEGTVILDVTGMGKIDPAGAAEWRGFLQMITPGSESIFLLGVPPVFLEKLTKPEDLGAKAQVLTFAMPYSCAKCATTASQIIDVEQHYDVLKFATPPEMKCNDCKNPTVCAASEALLSHLPTLPKPSVSADTKRFIKDVRERKPAVKKQPTTVAEVAAAQRGGNLTLVLSIVAIVCVLGIGGFLGWRYVNEKNKGGGRARADVVGAVLNKSADARPAWITSDVRFASYCNTNGSGGAGGADGAGLSCVGVSSYAGSEEDAREEAREAALEGLVNAIGLRITDRGWQQNVAKIFGEVRQNKLAAYEAANDDAKLDRARREIRDARKAVAAALRKTNGGALPATPSNQYWEEYEASGGDGSRFLVFVEFALPAAEVQRMVDTYSMSSTALGATAVTAFPGIAWRYPDVDTGAVITQLDKGDLKSIGLSEQYVLLEIQGRTVKDAASFAKAITETVADLKKNGGSIDLMIKTGDTPARKFNAPVQADKVETPSSSGSSGGSNSGSRPGTGNVNVWERYEDGKGGNRDDPTQ